uniref:Cytotoxic and regulatory T cell molecule n=1 Tax=Terrapene triunguis TaxID=2587831 RepID=A0A674IKM3_9SAUR
MWWAGDFQEVHTESVTVEEGQDLSLQCDFTGDHESALEWSNPRGFVIFLKSHRGLKDQRYKLIHYSKNKLSISLSNVTVQDEGTYTCFYYDTPVKTKKVNVTVLAAPSKPQLEVSDIRTNGKEEKIVLSCFTQGSKPPPQITWLLNNGLEVYGDIKHQFEHDGKKCNTTSSLVVHAYNRDSTASCVIRHETLRGERLTVSFQFENFIWVSDQTTERDKEVKIFSTFISTEPERTLNVTEETSVTDVPAISNEQSTQNSNITTVQYLVICNFLFAFVICTENDTSEQTLESYKSRSNEDNQAPEKNGQGKLPPRSQTSRKRQGNLQTLLK